MDERCELEKYSGDHNTLTALWHIASELGHWQYIKVALVQSAARCFDHGLVNVSFELSFLARIADYHAKEDV